MTEKGKQQRAQLDFAKRAFRYRQLKDSEPSVEDEWERFAGNHSAELDALEAGITNPSQHNKTPHSHQLRKIAASFIGFLFVAGIAFAAIHIVRQTNRQKPQTELAEPSATAKPMDAVQTDTQENDTTATGQRVFDNVTLDVMLTEIAPQHHVSVEFQNEQTRNLRFYFVWKREDSLDQVVEKLNHFEAVNIVVEDEKLIVR